MTRIAIVDDERIVRQALAQLVDWAVLDCEIVGEAWNGQDALALLDKTPADVVFTDIRMPGLDGVELIRRASVAHPAVRFVVLSAYGDFHLVRSAYLAGARDYILKSELCEAQVSAVIGQVRAELEQERRGRDLGGILSSFPDAPMLVEQLLLQKLLSGDPQAVRQALGRLGRDGGQVDPGALCVVMVVCARGRDASLPAVRRIIEALSAGHVLERRKGDYAVLLPWPRKGEGIPELLGRIRERVREEEGIQCYGGRSDPGPVEEAGRLCDQATEAASRFFLCGEMRLYEPETSAAQPHLDHAKVGSNVELLRSSLATPGELRVPTLAASLCPPAGSLSVADIPAVRSLFERYLFHLREHAEACKLGSAMTSSLEELAAALAAGSLDDLNGSLRHCLIRLASLRAQGNLLVRKACEYVAASYAHDPSLAHVAESLGVTAAHLSRLFRRETGESFKAYLARTRMAEATRLMRQTNLKVHEIAERVGYHNPGSFSRAFRNRSGQSPKHAAG